MLHPKREENLLNVWTNIQIKITFANQNRIKL